MQHSTPAEPAIPPHTSQLAFQVVCIQGACRGSVVPLTALPFMIGRDAHCDLQVPDLEASRLHCVIKYENNCLCLQDLESRNGTMLNLRKIAESAELKPGDLLTIGRTTLKLEKTDTNNVPH